VPHFTYASAYVSVKLFAVDERLLHTPARFRWSISINKMSYEFSGRTIFVLGAPRSGTTWLAKIFDSHPGVIYRHEPDILDRGEDLPFIFNPGEAAAYTRRAEDYLNALVQIRKLKTAGTWPVLAKSYHTPLETLERKALITILKLAQQVPHLKNFANSVTIPDFMPLATGAWDKLVLKSVSSMGRAGVFAAAAPESRFIVIVRHPCGQVESMLRGIRSDQFEEQVPLMGIAQTPQAKRRGLTAEKLAKLSITAKLAWSWVVQNEMAMEGLAGAKHAKTVRYLDLAKDPTETAKALFEFCELDWRPEVDAYLAASTQSSGREGYYELKRDPVTSANKWRSRLTPEAIEEICAIAQESEAGRMFGDAMPEEIETER